MKNQNRLSRRSVFKSAVAGVAGIAGAGVFISQQRQQVAQATANEESIEALVIGSGFGGSVAALRLGQAGYQTVVLERGLRWMDERPG